MREILFRAKRTDNVEWIYGDLLQIPDPHDGKMKCSIMEQRAVAKNYFVISTTVGQYTGLTDKNGVKIFEGDIVHAYFSEYCSLFYDPDAVLLVEDITDGVCVSLDNAEFIEVIGNIHDNPELMEGGD